MNLTEAQRQQVAAWIAAGAKLSEIQNRLAAEMGLRLTYMDVRLLMDDLRLTPKDPQPAQTPPPRAESPAPAATIPPTAPENVSVTVDELTRPGAIVSGKVMFSDGQKATWYLDQMGRLGVAPAQQGYKPSPADVEQFQLALEGVLAKAGF